MAIKMICKAKNNNKSFPGRTTKPPSLSHKKHKTFSSQSVHQKSCAEGHCFSWNKQHKRKNLQFLQQATANNQQPAKLSHKKHKTFPSQSVHEKSCAEGHYFSWNKQCKRKNCRSFQQTTASNQQSAKRFRAIKVK